MKHLLPHFAIAMALSTLLLTSCQQEEARFPETSGKGNIVLTFSEAVAYVDVQTRAEQPLENLSDYDFTLSGTTAEGETVVNRPITVDGTTASIDAGTYTLNVQGNSTLAAASQTGLGAPYYAGTSVDANGQAATFTVNAGGTTEVRALLKPVNAKLTIQLATSFTAFYKTATLTVGSRVIPLLALTDADAAPTNPTVVDTYFPASTLSYTLTASARAGSHVTDIAATHASVNLAAGTHNTITLSANPVTGELIPVVSGEHTGTFD